MKGERYILLIGLYVVLCTPLFAQPRLRTAEYSLGVHGGVSASSVIFSPRVSNMTPITNACVLGGNGGLVFRYAGHKYCGLQLELNYLHRGWAEKAGTGESYSRSLHYIEIPFLMHLNFGKDKWRWFLNLGPQIGYCVKEEKYRGVMVNGSGQAEYQQPIDHPFDWGLLVGTGVYCKTRKAGTYQLEVRFDYSFGGIYGTSLLDHFSMASPIDLSINLAYLWNFKKNK